MGRKVKKVAQPMLQEELIWPLLLVYIITTENMS